MNSYIIYNSEYNILICKEHECAIFAEFLMRYFHTKHEISLKRRQEILSPIGDDIDTLMSALSL